MIRQDARRLGRKLRRQPMKGVKTNGTSSYRRTSLASVTLGVRRVGMAVSEAVQRLVVDELRNIETTHHCRILLAVEARPLALALTLTLTLFQEYLIILPVLS